MSSQLPPPPKAPRLDGRTLIAAACCVLALFFDLFGWLLAIAGIILLRRATFSRGTKWLLGAVAILPKILFIGVRSLNAPHGLSFPIEPRTLATSPSLWAWCILLAAGGVYLMFQRQLKRGLRIVLGLVAIAGAAVILLGLPDGFHRIDDAGGGRWALRHAARGNVAVFTASEVASIDAKENRPRKGPSSYSIRVALDGGRSYSVTTKSPAALDELRKFATTANLPDGKVTLNLRRSRWTNSASAFNLKDCVGTYELADKSSTIEFWLEGDRLAGKETTSDSTGRHVRNLRNIKLSDTGGVEFDPGTYFEASQKDDGKISLSFSSSTGETGRFVPNGLELGARKFRKQ